MGKTKGSGTRSRRGGKPTGSSNSGGKSKTSSSPPQGAALQVKLFANDGFDEALREKACPVKEAERAENAGDAAGSAKQLRLESWEQAEQLLSWFKEGAAMDNTARLEFSTQLTSEHRSELHSLADDLGLESRSQGTENSRHIALYSKGAAPSKAKPTEDVKEKGQLLYQLAKEEGLKVSRDEVIEMLEESCLTPELRKIWKEKGEDQETVIKLIKAASRGELDELKTAIDASPLLVKEGAGDKTSKMTPLHAAAAQGHLSCLQALLQAGAPLEVADRFGQTPLEVSRKFEQMDTEAALLRAGAKDPAGSKTFEQNISVENSQQQSGGQASAKKISTLEAAVNAKPFVPKKLKAIQESKSMSEIADSGPDGHTAPSSQADEPAGISTPIRSSFENAAGPPIRGRDEAEPNGKDQQKTTKSAEAAAEQMDPQQFPGGWVEASQPPVVARKPSRKLPAIVGGRSLSSNLPEGLAKEYSNSPNLKDPRAATRGAPGASAVALGRRIIENAAAESHRYGSAGLSGDLDKFPYAEPSQPPAVTSGKLSGVPNVVGGRGVLQQGNDKVQMSKPRGSRPADRIESQWKDNKHRVNAWMESAPEEHSSSLLPSSSSTPNLQGIRGEEKDEEESASKDRQRPGTAKSADGTESAATPKEGSYRTPRPQGSSKEDPEERQGAPDTGKEGKPADPQPEYQDPRGAAIPTAPPVASGAHVAIEPEAGQAGTSETHKPLEKQAATETAPASPVPESEEERKDEGKDAASREEQKPSIDNLVSGAIEGPYAEGTQPPEVAGGGLSKIPAVVGGQGVSSKNLAEVADKADGTPAAMMDAKRATYGKKGPSATVLGKAVIENPTLQMERFGSAGLSGDLDKFAYLEPSQPPKGPAGKLSGIPNVVGGKSVSNTNKTSSQALEAEVAPQSSAEETTSAAEPSEQKETVKQSEAATAAGPSKFGMERISEERSSLGDLHRPGSFSFPKPTESSISGNTTADAIGRPKGLGNTQGLPQKRLSSSKSPKGKSEDMARVLSTEASAGSREGSEKSPTADVLSTVKEGVSTSLEKLSSLRSSLADKLSEEEPATWIESWKDWVSENNVLVLGGVAAAGATLVGFAWLKLRR